MQGKCYGYLRVSGDGQIDGDGFPRQEEAVRKYAEAQGLTVERVYRDEGVKGATETEARPAWYRMILDSDESGINVIVVEKLERLSRDLIVQEMTIRNCAKRNLTLFSAAEGDTRDDPDNPSRRLIRQIIGAIAEFDRANITLRMMKARRRKRMAGERCEGRKPYGHYPGEAEALQAMLAWRREGCNYSEIVRRCTEAGFPVRGRRWHHGTVIDLIREHARKPAPDNINVRDAACDHVLEGKEG